MQTKSCGFVILSIKNWRLCRLLWAAAHLLMRTKIKHFCRSTLVSAEDVRKSRGNDDGVLLQKRRVKRRACQTTRETSALVCKVPSRLTTPSVPNRTTRVVIELHSIIEPKPYGTFESPNYCFIEMCPVIIRARRINYI